MILDISAQSVLDNIVILITPTICDDIWLIKILECQAASLSLKTNFPPLIRNPGRKQCVVTKGLADRIVTHKVHL